MEAGARHRRRPSSAEPSIELEFNSRRLDYLCLVLPPNLTSPNQPKEILIYHIRMEQPMVSAMLLRYSKFQIRIHANDWEPVRNIITNYIDKAERVLVFHHKNGKLEKPHFHIYLFNISITDTALRKYLKNYFKGNKAFSVASTCSGTRNEPITPYGAYQYGTNDSIDIVKELNLVEPTFTKGFGDSTLQEYKEMSAIYYEKEITKIKDANSPDDVLMMYREKSDCTWDRLYEAHQRLNKSDPQGCPKSYAAIKRWIQLDYLNRAKPTPRTADLHRYAMALSLIRNGMVSDEELIAFNSEQLKSTL